MLVKYSRAFILEAADLAKKYGACGNAVNFGEVMLVAIHGSDHTKSKYNLLFDRLQLPFGERDEAEVRDEVVRQGDKMCIAYSIKENGIKIVMSSDATLNQKLINGLFLKSVSANAVL